MGIEPVENKSTEFTIGCVAICKGGKYAVITKIVRVTDGRMYFTGIGFDGNPWISMSPTFIASSVDEYMRNQLW